MRWRDIIPRRFSEIVRSSLIYRKNKQVYRRRHEVAERISTNIGLTHPEAGIAHHILFIIIDCLRHDHVSLYNYTRKTTPFLENLANDAAVFRDAISPSSWTYPSVASILTGLYPHSHNGVYAEDLRNFNEGMMPQKVRENVLFLPEILGHFGFTTYLGSAIIPAELPIRGCFQQTSVCHLRSAEDVLRSYVRWLQTHQQEMTFAYLQLGDIHEPIHAPEPYRSAFGTIPNIPLLERWDYRENAVPGDVGFERYRENRIKLYDSALLYIDAQLQKFFQHLKTLKLMDKVLVVITADHGEEMWDHLKLEKEHFFDPREFYGVGHGHHLWQEVVRVPLMIFGPQISAQEIYQRVTLIDLVPTILEYCGIKGWGKMTLDGQNFFAHFDKRIILSEDVSFGYEKKVVFKEKYKLYYSKGDGVKWIFDLSKDPEEKSPLDLPQVANHLSQYLLGEETRTVETVSIDEETKKRLRDLGYID